MSVSGTARLVYRPVVSRIVVVGYVVFALWWAVDDFVTGDTREVAVAAPLLLAIGLVLWGVFWRPAVVVDDDGVELRNVVRDVYVPWTLLEGLDTRYALTLLVGDRRYRSWAAGAPGRPAALAHPGTPHDHVPTGEGGAVRSSRSLRADSGAAAFMVEQRWEQRRTSPAAGNAQRAPGEAQRTPGEAQRAPGEAQVAAGSAQGPAREVQVRVRWHWLWPAAAVAAASVSWLASLTV